MLTFLLRLVRSLKIINFVLDIGVTCADVSDNRYFGDTNGSCFRDK